MEKTQTGGVAFKVKDFERDGNTITINGVELTGFVLEGLDPEDMVHHDEAFGKVAGYKGYVLSVYREGGIAIYDRDGTWTAVAGAHVGALMALIDRWVARDAKEEYKTLPRLCLTCGEDIRSLHHKALRCAPCAHEWKTSGRFVAYYHNSEEYRKRQAEYKDREGVRERANQRRRERYQNDPEHRAEVLKKLKQWRQDRAQAVKE